MNGEIIVFSLPHYISNYTMPRKYNNHVYLDLRQSDNEKGTVN